MGLNVISENDNKLLNRKEYKAEIEFTGATPNKNDVANMIASKAGCETKLVVVKIVDTHYGEQKATVEAVAYKSLDDLKKLEKYEEPAPEEKPEGEAPAAASEEKPAEEAEKKE
ncbi:hypothetical protein H6503_02940 [Candidatus Woesearchaeota archaeon]|nr:hypothetical protein [Candidatus Woesearchaeota archaeon]